MDSDDLRRRLKAGRALTPPSTEELARRMPRTRNATPGLTVEELAARLDEPGLGEKTLGAIERGERAAQRRDLIVIAQALAMPLGFFTLSRSELLEALQGAGAPGVPGDLGRRLRDRQPTEAGHERPEIREGEGRSQRAGG
jgi:transcriptional regulator with XRE-family HTH domain